MMQEVLKMFCESKQDKSVLEDIRFLIDKEADMFLWMKVDCGETCCEAYPIDSTFDELSSFVCMFERCSYITYIDDKFRNEYLMPLFNNASVDEIKDALLDYPKAMKFFINNYFNFK